MTRRGGTPRQERREAIARQLLDAVERLMGDGLAFTQVSVDRLAGEAGISRATFYVYYEDKGRLLQELSQHVFDELADAAAVWWDVADARSPDDLHTAMRGVIAVYRRHRTLLRAVSEMATYDPEVSDMYVRLLDGNTERLIGIIERNQAGGAFPDLPARATASALTWMVERTCHAMIRPDDPDFDATLAGVLTEIVWRTLYLSPAGAAAVQGR